MEGLQKNAFSVQKPQTSITDIVKEGKGSNERIKRSLDARMADGFDPSSPPVIVNLDCQPDLTGLRYLESW